MTRKTNALSSLQVLSWFSPAEHQVPTKATLSLCFSNGQCRENTMEGLWAQTSTGRDHSPFTITGKTDSTWGNRFNLSSIKLEQDNKNSNQILKNTFPPPLPSSWAQLHSQFSLPPLPTQYGGGGEWGLQSVHHTLSLPILPPQGEDSSHSAPAPS